MTDHQTAAKQLQLLLESVRDEAYQQGFRDAVDLLKNHLETIETPKPSERTQVVAGGDRELPERRPAGENKLLVKQVLAQATGRGMTQATIRRFAARHGHSIAQSSVRHAIRQLKRDGVVEPVGRRWRLVSSEEETAGSEGESGPAESGNPNNGGTHYAAA